MRALSVTDIGSDNSLSLVSALKHEHDNSCTKRVAELVERVARLRSELEEAETALEFEKARMPVPGDFVRCPLTSFFGRVTKVVARPSGRPWIEIVPYLGPNLPGHSSMDLFDSWELIDPPSADIRGGRVHRCIAQASHHRSLPAHAASVARRARRRRRRGGFAQEALGIAEGDLVLDDGPLPRGHLQQFESSCVCPAVSLPDAACEALDAWHLEDVSSKPLPPYLPSHDRPFEQGDMSHGRGRAERTSSGRECQA